jgi:hypothetical protein
MGIVVTAGAKRFVAVPENICSKSRIRRSIAMTSLDAVPEDAVDLGKEGWGSTEPVPEVDEESTTYSAEVAGKVEYVTFWGKGPAWIDPDAKPPKAPGTSGPGKRRVLGQRNFNTRFQVTHNNKTYWNTWCVCVAQDDQGNKARWVSAIFVTTGGNGQPVPGVKMKPN